LSQEHLIELYLGLLEQTLTGAILEDIGFIPSSNGVSPPVLDSSYQGQARLLGKDWPSHAHTMIGLTRLRSLRRQVVQVLNDDIPGDFIETGVWRGGACILIRAVLAVYGVKDRHVWVADSFAGLPPPNANEFPQDGDVKLHKVQFLAVSLDEVRNNFAKYNMLDDQVRFLKGWFKDTLPHAPIEKLAILRLDGDMYESTIQALASLYHKVSPGGFVIVDDYSLSFCQQAITDFREQNRITDSLEAIDRDAVYWRKRR
jgi:O-methyltransferase